MPTSSVGTARKDPVWKRLQAIYGFYGAAGEPVWPCTAGAGCSSRRPRRRTATTSARPHRKQMHPAMQKWFGIADATRSTGSPARYRAALRGGRGPRRSASQDSRESAPGGPYRRGANGRASAGNGTAHPPSTSRGPAPQLVRLAGRRRARGDCPSFREAKAGPSPSAPRRCRRSRSVSSASPARRSKASSCRSWSSCPRLQTGRPQPCVLGVAQDGKEGFLKGRADEIARLLAHGIAVCLPDCAARARRAWGRIADAPARPPPLSSSEMMLGNTLVGLRLKDLRSVLHWLRTLSGDRPAPDRRLGRLLAPRRTGRTAASKSRWASSEEPDLAEPLGPLLALLAGLFEDDVAAVVARGGLVGFRSVLGSPFVYVPHDVIVPGALTAGDIADVAAALAPRPVLAERFVDGTNRAVPAEAVRQQWAIAASAYQSAGARRAGDRGRRPALRGLARQAAQRITVVGVSARHSLHALTPSPTHPVTPPPFPPPPPGCGGPESPKSHAIPPIDRLTASFSAVHSRADFGGLGSLSCSHGGSRIGKRRHSGFPLRGLGQASAPAADRR